MYRYLPKESTPEHTTCFKFSDSFITGLAAEELASCLNQVFLTHMHAQLNCYKQRYKAAHLKVHNTAEFHYNKPGNNKNSEK